MDKPIYVKITKQPAGNEYWYYDRIGVVYPVEENPHNENFYYISGLTVDRITGKPRPMIAKSDCEVVPTLQPETPDYTDAISYANAQGINLQSEIGDVMYWKVVHAFEAGYSFAKSEPLPEGQHLISTNQLCILYNDTDRPDFIKQYLQEWFPTVFVPAKTYQIGQRFMMNGETEKIEMILAEAGINCVSLVRLTNGSTWQVPIKVKNIYEITEAEMHDIQAGYNCFTLLPDTTDQMV